MRQIHVCFDEDKVDTAEIISGTISVVFDTDPDGNVRRRMKVTKLDIKRPDGRTETQSITETLERRLISRSE